MPVPNPSNPDPLARYQDFTTAVGERLEAGAQAYGDRSFSLPPVSLVAELEQEALDLAGWGYVLWHRLERMRGAAGRLHVARPAMAYHATTKQPLRVVVDTREQTDLPWSQGIETTRAKLDYGDFSAVGLTDTLAIEAKHSWDDLAACVTGERDRFERELEGLAKNYRYRALLIAGTERELLTAQWHSKVTTKSVMASLWAWQMDFHIPVVLTGDLDGQAQCIEWHLRRAQAKAAKAAKQPTRRLGDYCPG
jgi:hypothetical protein